MSVSLKRLDLLLDEDLVARLEEESRLQRASVSDVVGRLLARDLGMAPETHSFVERIRKASRRDWFHWTGQPGHRSPVTRPGMVRRVFDTSVTVKWFLQEEGTDRAEVFLSQLEQGAAKG